MKKRSHKRKTTKRTARRQNPSERENKYIAAKYELYDGINNLIMGVRNKYGIISDKKSQFHIDRNTQNLVLEIMSGFPAEIIKL